MLKSHKVKPQIETDGTEVLERRSVLDRPHHRRGSDLERLEQKVLRRKSSTGRGFGKVLRGLSTGMAKSASRIPSEREINQNLW